MKEVLAQMLGLPQDWPLPEHLRLSARHLRKPPVMTCTARALACATRWPPKLTAVGLLPGPHPSPTISVAN